MLVYDAITVISEGLRAAHSDARKHIERVEIHQRHKRSFAPLSKSPPHILTKNKETNQTNLITKKFFFKNFSNSFKIHLQSFEILLRKKQNNSKTQNKNYLKGTTRSRKRKIWNQNLKNDPAVEFMHGKPINTNYVFKLKSWSTNYDQSARFAVSQTPPQYTLQAIKRPFGALIVPDSNQRLSSFQENFFNVSSFFPQNKISNISELFISLLIPPTYQHSTFTLRLKSFDISTPSSTLSPTKSFLASFLLHPLFQRTHKYMQLTTKILLISSSNTVPPTTFQCLAVFEKRSVFFQVNLLASCSFPKSHFLCFYKNRCNSSSLSKKKKIKYLLSLETFVTASFAKKSIFKNYLNFYNTHQTCLLYRIYFKDPIIHMKTPLFLVHGKRFDRQTNVFGKFRKNINDIFFSGLSVIFLPELSTHKNYTSKQCFLLFTKKSFKLRAKKNNTNIFSEKVSKKRFKRETFLSPKLSHFSLNKSPLTNSEASLLSFQSSSTLSTSPQKQKSLPFISHYKQSYHLCKTSMHNRENSIKDNQRKPSYYSHYRYSKPPDKSHFDSVIRSSVGPHLKQVFSSYFFDILFFIFVINFFYFL